MLTKVCTDCKTEKEITEFSKQKRGLLGVHSICKFCNKTRTEQYNRTKAGVITGIYSGQKKSSKRRDHTPPSYTKVELTVWLYANGFDSIYDKWISTNYNTKLKPSVDRLNDYEPYSLSNIQLVTWGENETKSYKDRKNGVNNKRSKSVTQFDDEYKFIATYHSACEASRITDTLQGKITECCKGRRKSTNSFKWKYTEEVA